MKDYGWSYDYSDTLPEKTSHSLLLLGIKENNLVDWTVKKSKKHHPKWRINHTISIQLQERVNTLMYLDQLMTGFVQTDTISLESVFTNQIIAEFDFENILEIVRLSELNSGFLPNHFDNGIGIYFKINMIIWYNLKAPSNFHKTWETLYPYIEKTYLAGKISYTIFQMYDEWHFQFYGTQVYGTLGDGIEVKLEIE